MECIGGVTAITIVFALIVLPIWFRIEEAYHGTEYFKRKRQREKIDAEREREAEAKATRLMEIESEASRLWEKADKLCNEAARLYREKTPWSIREAIKKEAER